MKLRYVGESFGAVGLTNGHIYIATVYDRDYYRVFDDSAQDYMYPRVNPRPCDGSSPGGKWEIVEDMTEEERELEKRIQAAVTPDEENLLREMSQDICDKYAEIYAEEAKELGYEYELSTDPYGIGRDWDKDLD